MRLLSILLLNISMLGCLTAQIAVNQWRTHFSYYNMQQLHEVGSRIYSIGSAGFMYYDKEDNSTTILTKLDGLSENLPATMYYDQETKMILIGYASGMVDVIKEGDFAYFTEINRKTNLMNKRVNHITRIDDEIYLSCGFGILVFDPTINLFTKTIFIGDGGTQIEILKLIEGNDKLYALALNGIYSIGKNENAEIFSNWNFIDNYAGEYTIKNVVWFNNKLWAAAENKLTSTFELLTINETSYQVNTLLPSAYNLNINTSNNALVVCYNGTVYVYNSSLNVLTEKVIFRPTDALLDSDNQLWIADRKFALYGIVDGVQIKALPNGPRFPQAGNINYFNHTIYVCGGNKNSLYNRRGYYKFVDEKWESYYNDDDIGSIDPLWPNVSHMAIDPNNPSRIFGSAIRYGLMEFENDVLINHYNNDNSTLDVVDGVSDTSEYRDIRIAGMDFDSKGNLWIATNFTKEPISVLTTGGKWYDVPIKYGSLGPGGSEVTGLVIDDYDQKWLLVKNNGVVVFKETDDTYKQVDKRAITIANQDGISRSSVYSGKKDTKGNIWVGTDNGPVVYSNVDDILTRSNTLGFQTKIPRDDGTNEADFLLETVGIVDLDFDGANRMWLATESAGAFLISEDGLEEVHHFTKENSPLTTNNIISVEMNDATGEVFFSTSDGVISYRSNSTLGGTNFGKVYVYPNPVRPDYDGDIYIAELALNANVKITDISGNLVFETTALGSQAVWDGHDLWGNEVNTGVYLVFCTNEDATETFVTKLLFIK